MELFLSVALLLFFSLPDSAIYDQIKLVQNFMNEIQHLKFLQYVMSTSNKDVKKLS